MLIVCAYCGKVIEEKEPIESRIVSHGCCKECYLKELEKLKEEEKKDNR